MSETSKILVTGATGFLGSALLCSLRDMGIHVEGSIRRQNSDKSLINVGELSDTTDWSKALAGKDVVVHCAGAAHNKSMSTETFHRVNVLATQRLVEQCLIEGVRQFIFISSLGVNGSVTKNNVYTASDQINPTNAYTKSKAEAEEFIVEYLADKDMYYTIIRPPLIYGSNAPGNFGALMRIIDKHIPLPLAGVDNRRSMVGIRNLISLIVCCMLNKAAYNQVFLVSDNNDVSTDELLRKVSKISGKSILLFPFPKVVIKYIAGWLKKEAVYQGLFESLQVDISETCNRLGWLPPYTMEQELTQCFQKTVK